MKLGGKQVGASKSGVTQTTIVQQGIVTTGGFTGGWHVAEYSRLPEGKRVFSINHIVYAQQTTLMIQGRFLSVEGAVYRSSSQTPAKGRLASRPF